MSRAAVSSPAVEPSPLQPLAQPKTYSVRELIAELRQHVERSYTGLISVEGEISNCRPAASGHIYFTLKDGDAQLPVVIFRREAMLSAFKPKDGAAVEVRGRISVYESRGQLQLIGEWMQPRGTGALQLAFDQLKQRLRREGLFDRPRKPLPAFPQCLGIVTSPNGAALQDILQVVRRRHARLNILVYPAAMQGAHCASSVVAGVRCFNRHPEMVDLILVSRGGGSFEDLDGFNQEIVARAIAASTLPVVAGIGHEVDSTIADFVADLRAPTPSAAAELITAAQHRIEERVLALDRRVRRAGEFNLMQTRRRLERLSAAHVLARLRDSILLRTQRVDELRFRLEAARSRRVATLRAQSVELEARLRKHDPALRLALSQGRLASATERLARLRPDLLRRRADHVQALALRARAAQDKRLSSFGARIAAFESRCRTQSPKLHLAAARRKSDTADDRLRRAGQQGIARRRTELELAVRRLNALSPLAVLQRGYSIVYAEDGSILRSINATQPGQEIRAQLAEGALRATVLEKETG